MGTHQCTNWNRPKLAVTRPKLTIYSLIVIHVGEASAAAGHRAHAVCAWHEPAMVSAKATMPVAVAIAGSRSVAPSKRRAGNRRSAWYGKSASSNTRML